jgi:hypothetical protein
MTPPPTLFSKLNIYYIPYISVPPLYKSDSNCSYASVCNRLNIPFIYFSSLSSPKLSLKPSITYSRYSAPIPPISAPIPFPAKFETLRFLL